MKSKCFSLAVLAFKGDSVVKELRTSVVRFVWRPYSNFNEYFFRRYIRTLITVFLPLALVVTLVSYWCQSITCKAREPAPESAALILSDGPMSAGEMPRGIREVP